MGVGVSLGVFFLDAVSPAGIAVGVPYIVPVILSLWSPVSRDVFFAAGLGTLLTLVGAWVSAAPLDSAVESIDVLNRGLSLGAIWGTGGAVYLFHRSKVEIDAYRDALYRSEQHRRNQDSLAHLGRMAAVVAHEVRNPLAGLKAALQVLSGRAHTEPERHILEEMQHRIDGLTASLEDMLVYARPPELLTHETDLAELVGSVIARFHEDPVSHGVDVHQHVTHARVTIDARLIGDALFNLLLNAAQALEGDGAIHVSAREVDNEVVLAVRDTGPGIPDDVRERLFEPFFTTKVHGTGLGLAIVAQTVHRHDGTIKVITPEEGGTAVLVHLPRTGPCC